MKITVAIAAAFLVLEMTCFVVPEQEQAVVSSSNFNSLERVKRSSCSCGPYGCSCTLREPEESEHLHRNKRNVTEEELTNNAESAELKRIKRSCSCGPYGCSCTLREDEGNEQIQRNKRNANDELLAKIEEPAELKRTKRSCSCGPYGCSCGLEDTDDSFLKIFGVEVQSTELKRSKRSSNNDESALVKRTKRCFCEINGCGCTDSCGRHGCILREPEENEQFQRNKRNANEKFFANNADHPEWPWSKCCGYYACDCPSN